MYVCHEPDVQQLELFERSIPFTDKLDRTNRWIRMAHAIDWHTLEVSYAKLFAETVIGHLKIRQAWAVQNPPGVWIML